MEEVKRMIDNVPLNMECVVDVADLAAQFDQFPTVSDPILLKCVQFLKNQLGATWKILRFTVNLSGNGQEQTMVKLIALMDLTCPSCKQEKCKSGELLDSQDKFIPGCKLVVNRQNTYWGANNGEFVNHLYTVVSMAKNQKVKVSNIPNQINSYYISYINNNDSLPTFCYKCDQ